VVSTFSLYYSLKYGLQIFDIQDMFGVALKEKRFGFRSSHIRSYQQGRIPAKSPSSNGARKP
jgi:hypothetical protein